MDCSNDKEPWDWHREDYCLQKSFNYAEISQGLWNNVPQNEDLSYVFNDETTPVKACGEFAYDVNNSESNNIQKEQDKCLKSSYQIKRRRMLQFNTQDGGHSLSKEQMSSAYLKVKGKEDSNVDVYPELSHWVSGASGSASASNYEDLESAEGWLADCFKDDEMQLCPDDLNFSGADDVHIDVADLCNFPPACEQHVVQHRITQTSKNIVFKGGKSFIETPKKLASSVAYPFSFIKPSGAHGDVTLKEINQCILSPPPLKSKQSMEDPSAYPKSVFSGKPVVGKTKIQIEGGKGSITIVRTKG
ncbi:XRI1 protein [Spatholobus suberectus]|nr:XRI1 protein [Spatholobus suberectus]